MLQTKSWITHVVTRPVAIGPLAPEVSLPRDWADIYIRNQSILELKRSGNDYSLLSG